MQGAIGWLWARSPAAVPIPGFKTPAQVEENVGAIRFGPLRPVTSGGSTRSSAADDRCGRRGAPFRPALWREATPPCPTAGSGATGTL